MTRWGSHPGDDIDDFVAIVTGSSLANDLNADNNVNGLDVEPFVNVLLSGSFTSGADVNRDGAVNGLDVELFAQAVLAGGAPTSVPAGGLEQPDTALAMASILRALDRLGHVHPESYRTYVFSTRSNDAREERGSRQLHHNQNLRRTGQRVLAKRSQIAALFSSNKYESPRGTTPHEVTDDWQAAVDRALGDDADWIDQGGA